MSSKTLKKARCFGFNFTKVDDYRKLISMESVATEVK